MVPVLVCGLGLTTVAMMFSVCGTPELTVPTFHNPVARSEERRVGKDDRKLTPAGSWSVTCTPVAASGAVTDGVTVKVIVSPTLGVASLTVLASDSLACPAVAVMRAV